MAHPLRLGVVYDFRNPPDSGIATPALYAADRRPGGMARRPRPRPGVVHRAPLRRRRVPAVVGSRGGRDGVADAPRAVLVGHLPPAVQPSRPARRGPGRPRQPERRPRRDRCGHGLRAPRVSRLRHPAAPAAVADRGGTRGPPPLLQRRALQLRRPAVPPRRRGDPPALRPARRPAALAGRHVAVGRRAGGAVRREPPAAGAARRRARSMARGARRDPAAIPRCTAWASSAAVSSPTIPSATGRRCARPSAIAGRSTPGSSPRRAATSPSSGGGRRASRRRGWSATPITVWPSCPHSSPSTASPISSPGRCPRDFGPSR